MGGASYIPLERGQDHVRLCNVRERLRRALQGRSRLRRLARSACRGRMGLQPGAAQAKPAHGHRRDCRSEEHTSELQSLMRISYAVFCLKKKQKKTVKNTKTR